MRPSNKSRSRSKSSNNGGNHNNNQRRHLGNIINRVFESAGPDGKVRGTPQQIIDKYQALARDAQLSGDRVAAESFLQHSEHYSRLLGEAQRQQTEQRGGQEREEGQRFEDGQPAPRSHAPNSSQPEIGSSGLTTIDTSDGDDDGPVVTPEGIRQSPVAAFQDAPEARPEPAPAAEPQPVVETAEEPAAPAPVKRPRTRRKAKVEPVETTTPVEAE